MWLCPCCHGIVLSMGVLGNTEHGMCCACGTQVHREVEEASDDE